MNQEDRLNRLVRRVKLEKEMASRECRGCSYEEDINNNKGFGVCTDDANICPICERVGISGPVLHTCKTTWMHPICSSCNEDITELEKVKIYDE